MKYFTFLLTSLFIGAAYAQTSPVKIVAQNDTETVLNGKTVEVVGQKTDFDVPFPFYVINQTEEIISVKYVRFRLIDAGILDQICDSQLCYSADDVDGYGTPVFDDLFPGQEMEFKPQVVPEGEDFCGIYKYYLMNEDFDYIDSVIVKFKTDDLDCTLSLSENEEFAFNIYPNPAQKEINLQFDSQNNKGNILVFLDALGREIERKIISNQKTIALQNFNKGVYFIYLLDEKNQKSETRKLIIQ